jgi:hypothetical protein
VGFSSTINSSGVGVLVDANHDDFVSMVLCSQDNGVIGGLNHGAPSSTISFVVATFIIANFIATSITTASPTTFVSATFVVGVSVGNFIDNAFIDLEEIKTSVCFFVASTYQGKAII